MYKFERMFRGTPLYVTVDNDKWIRWGIAALIGANMGRVPDVSSFFKSCLKWLGTQNCYLPQRLQNLRLSLKLTSTWKEVKEESSPQPCMPAKLHHMSFSSVVYQPRKRLLELQRG